jgi:rhamnosyltransferase subunit B
VSRAGRAVPDNPSRRAAPHAGLTRKVQSKRILFATLGSLGDLHPCLALAVELQRRGHAATIATTEYYRAKVQSLGLRFLPLGPAMDPTDGEMIRQCEDLKRGPEILFRRIVLPHLRETYEDLLRAAAGADLMVAGELNYAAPLVSEKLGLRWVSAILSPASFFSAHDPSVMVNVPWLIHVRKAGWRAYRAVFNLGRRGTRHWWDPVRELRREEGLRSDCDPLFRDKFSPALVLALFSPLLAQLQPDWPSQTRQTGFVIFDQHESSAKVDRKLAEFLAIPDPPIVFTQGSTAVHAPGSFYDVSAEAARRLGRRALLVGTDAVTGAPSLGIIAASYAPYPKSLAAQQSLFIREGPGRPDRRSPQGARS